MPEYWVRGRSSEQVDLYERELFELAQVLASQAMCVRDIRVVLAAKVGVMPAAATVHARLAALAERGYTVRGRKRRRKIPGKSGQRERVYSVVVPGNGAR